MNRCGECYACCELPEIKEINKPANKKCFNYNDACSGCGIYNDRPEVCRNYKCLWLSQEQIPDYYRPDKCGMVFEMPSGTLFYIGVEYKEGAHKQPIIFNLINKIVDAGHSVIVSTQKEGLKYKLAQGDNLADIQKKYNEIYMKA